MSQVEIRNLSKSFGQLEVLRDIDITVKDGEFLTLVGPSGCGKSTLIRIIAGLERQSAGSVLVDGKPVDHLRPHERKLAMVFQSYALYPHMSVQDNIAVPLAVQRLTLAERLPLIKYLSPRRPGVMRGISAEVTAVAQQLQIEELLRRKPAQLSGGQRQRVALGRAMVRDPVAFLMDEPLSNLDAKLRVHMRTELTDLHRRLGATFIYVTHDQVEAMTMSDRVAMMGAGHVLQLGSPAELYSRPQSLEVARFIGSPMINTIPARIGPNGRVEVMGRALGVATPLPEGSAATIGIRPEALAIVGEEAVPPRHPALQARLHRIENLGPEFLYHFLLGESSPVTLIVRRAVPVADLAVGGEVALTFNPSLCHIFGSDDRRIDHQAIDVGPPHAGVHA